MVAGESPAVAGSPTSQSSNGPLKSALGGRRAKEEPSESRVDSRNNIIEKGGAHHMVFLDAHTPGVTVEQVKEVTPYKNGAPGCGCTIS
mmetsp:Transcript_92597/g.258856  ORF Transcript_92597/g.258856 Transcript_92597/m.258856 type:complete len:89 (-) Transcript_92597:117-383(-)